MRSKHIAKNRSIIPLNIVSFNIVVYDVKIYMIIVMAHNGMASVRLRCH